jgi:hypothetical protein
LDKEVRRRKVRQLINKTEGRGSREAVEFPASGPGGYFFGAQGSVRLRDILKPLVNPFHGAFDFTESLLSVATARHREAKIKASNVSVVLLQ